ncbi:MAG: DUF559 domain-containing protein [Patescibacteria group bacterium]
MVWNTGKTKEEYPQLSNSGVKKGNIPWNKGKEYPATWLNKFRFGNRPKAIHRRKEKYTEEERKKIWGNRQGKHISKKHRLALLQSRLGKQGGMRGKKQSDKQKELVKNWSLNHLDRIKENGLKGLISQSKRKQTKPEKIIIDKLNEDKINHISQYLVNSKFLVDEYLPDKNLIIEVDGNYWHSLSRVVKKDKAENAYLKKCGYKVIRIPEDEVSNFSTASLL